MLSLPIFCCCPSLCFCATIPSLPLLLFQVLLSVFSFPVAMLLFLLFSLLSFLFWYSYYSPPPPSPPAPAVPRESSSCFTHILTKVIDWPRQLRHSPDPYRLCVSLHPTPHTPHTTSRNSEMRTCVCAIVVRKEGRGGEGALSPFRLDLRSYLSSSSGMIHKALLDTTSDTPLLCEPSLSHRLRNYAILTLQTCLSRRFSLAILRYTHTPTPSWVVCFLRRSSLALFRCAHTPPLLRNVC